MSRRQRRTKQRRRRNNPAANRRVRAATISGSLAATAAIGLGASAGSAEAASFDAVMVKNVDPAGGHGTQPVNLGGTLFFSGDDGINGRELWKSDGTDAGTTMVADINPGAGDSNPQYMTNVGGTLFFSATDGNDDGLNGATNHGTELWKSDGTAAGTTMVKDINANLQCSNGDQGDSRPRGLANVGGTLLFRACGGPDNGTTNGFELWKSNGTEAGTTLVKDINTNAADHNGDSYPSRPIDVGGTAFFTATDGTDDDPTAGGTQHGYELWKSASPFTDATLVKDINLASNSSPGSFFDAGGTLIFSANDGTNGRELWKSTDGTGTNTTRVEDINTTPSVTDSSYPGEFADFGGTLFFSATDGVNGQELWTTGPFDAANTTLFKDLDPSGDSDPYYFTNVGGTLFFTAYDASNGRELWSSNGTPTGTTFFKDVNPGAGGSYPYYPSSVGGTLFFTAFDTTSGRELWSSDGTATGTTLVKDINPGNPLPSNYGPYNFTDINGTRFFAANDGNGYELWKTVPASPAGPAAPISNQFSVAGKKGNKKKGTVQYTFNLPGGGVLSEKQAGNLSAEAVASKGSVIKPTSVSAAGAGPVKITIKPNKAGKSILAQKGKLRVSVKFTFTPTGGSPGSQTLKVLLKLA